MPHFLNWKLVSIILCVSLLTHCEETKNHEAVADDLGSVTSELSLKLSEQVVEEHAIELLESGLNEGSSFVAIQYINLAAEHAANIEVRTVLFDAVENRIHRGDKFVASACARVLPKLAQYEWDAREVVLRRNLELGNCDVAWFSIDAIGEMGELGKIYLSDLEQYMLSNEEEDNKAGLYSVSEALLKIGTTESLNILVNIKNPDVVVQRKITRAQTTLSEKSGRKN